MLGRSSRGLWWWPGRRALWIERLGLNRRDATFYGDWFREPEKGRASAKLATLWGLLLTPCVGELCDAAAAGHESLLSGTFGAPGDHSITQVTVTVTVTVTEHGSRITDHE